MSLHARFIEDERPEPAQLIDFTVEVDGIDGLCAGPWELISTGQHRLTCKWAGDRIEIVRIEVREWRGRQPVWTVADPVDDSKGLHLIPALIHMHFATEAGQQFLKAECDGQETEMRWEE